MRAILSLAAAAALTAAIALPAARAHHGVSRYDMGTVLTLDGTVEVWGWQSPHTSLELRVEERGETRIWDIEGAPPRWMEGQGWTPASLEAGEPVTITYHPSRLGGDGYDGILMEVERANGEVLKVNRPARLGGP